MRLIDADAIIKKIKERNPDDVPYEDAWAITCIEHAPTIDPERKTGKWIYAWNDYKCSVCGEIVLRHKYQFCPNCGAKMEGSK